MFCGMLDETHLLLRLEKGEEIIATLTHITQNHHITNATISGIGSVENPTLAHYRVDTKEYHEQKMEGIFEIIGMLGNITQSEGKPLIHIHATISDEQMHAMGGHIVTADVSATLEIVLSIFPSTITKSYHNNIGLKLLDMPACEIKQ